MITITLSDDNTTAYISPCRKHGLLYTELENLGGFNEAPTQESMTVPLSSNAALGLRKVMTGKPLSIEPHVGKILGSLADSTPPKQSFHVFPSWNKNNMIVDTQSMSLSVFAKWRTFWTKNPDKVREITDGVFLVSLSSLIDIADSFPEFRISPALENPDVLEARAKIPAKPERTQSDVPEFTFAPVTLPDLPPFDGYDGSLLSLRSVPLSAYEYIRNDSEKVAKANARSAGAGKKKKTQRSLLQKLTAIGVESAFDLLHYFPLRHIDRSKPQLIRSLSPGDEATVVATIADKGANYEKNYVFFVIEDAAGSRMRLTLFNQTWMIHNFSKGDEVIVHGKFSPFNGSPSIAGAKIDKVGDIRGQLPLIPVYPQSGKQEITTWDVLALVKETLGRIEALPLSEPLGAETLERYQIPDRNNAYRNIHIPDSKDTFKDANRRLIYEELLRLQLYIQQQKNDATRRIGIAQNAVLTPSLDAWKSRLPYELTNAQKRATEAIKENMASASPMHRLVQGDVGAGKAQPLDALVLTPKGYKTMGAIQKGDTVVTPDGGTASVLQVFPQGERDIFKVIFSDGSSVESDGDHLWNVRTSTACTRNSPTKTLTLNEIKNSLKEKNGASKWHVELASAVDLGDGSPLPVDPYLVGFLLGDGSLSDGISLGFTTADEESVVELSKFIPPGYSIKKYSKYGYGISRNRPEILAKGIIDGEESVKKHYLAGYSMQNISASWGFSTQKVETLLNNAGILRRSSQQKNPVTEELKKLGLMGTKSHNKFIPEIYKNTSIENRLALLQGLLDTDGTVSNGQGGRGSTVSFASVSENLAQDVAWIVRSLGGVARIAPRNRKSGFSWYVFVSLPNNFMPFRLSRKAKLVKEKIKYHPKRRAIRDVVYIGKKEAQCILIDHAEHLYVTDNFTVTHNTVVAAYTVFTTVDNGHQAALLAPTEILAEQLHNGIAADAEGLISPRTGELMNVKFLGGKTRAKEAREIRAALASGEIDVIVGTHAILTEETVYADLGTVVIDEQHRFGVEQRTRLRNARHDGLTPDMLVMTATPIPRSSAMVLYGDLDITVLDELPPGRTPIETIWVREEAQQAIHRPQLDAWNDIKQQVADGHQAYIVASLVEDNEKIAAQSVEDAYEALSGGIFAGYRMGMVHGKQKRDEREEIMKKFAAGEIDILVSTTVIEVGVNVPNSTIMVVLDPGRFGIAQLHQIRGRVGRSKFASRCYLIGDTKTEEGEFRLNALVESTDGFYLSEKDLELRGEGTLFSTKQSGQSDLYLAKIREHLHILEIAKEDAVGILAKDPNLQSETGKLFAGEITEIFGEKDIKS